MKEEKKEVKVHKKRNVTIYIILRILVVATMIAQLFRHNYDNVFLCILTLILFMIPSIVDKRLHISLPNTLEIIILLFIFAAEILGEIQNFYGAFQYWDTMLHTINGFLMAAIGFSMIDILNQSKKFHINMNPFFVALVAFCFSMTVGIMWEFFEYSMDTFMKTDMQKDRIVTSISSVELNPNRENIPVVIEEIEKTVIDGKTNNQPTQTTIEGGFLDIGINDTMKDLIVNCVGAIVFSVIGFLYIKNRGDGRFARQFIPTLKTKE